MVRISLSSETKLMLALTIGTITMTGCSSKPKTVTPDWSRNTAVVERTRNEALMLPGSATEKLALKRFNDFYADYSVAAIQEGVRNLYAEQAWFGDPFHIAEGIDEIEHYFLVMAEPVESCTFTVDSIQNSGIDYYARWTMALDSKVVKGEPIKTIGISHLRFNAEGKIIFQQDYWDTSAMFDRLPVVGYWTRLVKNRMEKGLEK